ncbi:MAG: hypothetical protein K2X77_29335 [Candidatus Obscuribacterales bacterium]|jgi:hypothetical protein|nr:hypothetical protein [Candidatus Obscuribacterales bacterium]
MFFGKAEEKAPDPQEVQRREDRNAIMAEPDPFKVAELLCKYDHKQWNSLIYGAKTETALKADGTIDFTIGNPRLHAVKVNSDYCKTIKK